MEEQQVATDKTPEKKKSKAKKEIIFSRPPFAEEVFTDDGKKNFNNLPGWQRHLVKQVIKHGDLKLAAQEAGVSSFVNQTVDSKLSEEKTMVESLNEGGITADFLISHLKECLEANHTRTDKHQNIIHMTDLDLKLKTIELILKIRGDLTPNKSKKSTDNFVDMFADTKIDE